MKKIKYLVSGFLSGFIIGLGGLCYTLANAYSTLGSIIGALIFPFGLFLICVLQIDLYTGKIGFVFSDKSITPLRLVLMLIGNLLGASLIGILCYLIFKDNQTIFPVITQIASKKLDLFNINLLYFSIKSILCGMMVFLAVHLYKKSSSDFMKFISVLIPIFIFVLCGFEHCIADMFYFTFALKFNLEMLVAIVISIIGNSLGALILYFILNFIEEKKD